MEFIITALDEKEFSSLFEIDDADLAKVSAVRMTVDAHPGFPCRVSLVDAAIGEEVILLTFQHHKTQSPYQSSGAIFIRKGAKRATLPINEIPKMLEHRLLSLRGYNNIGMMQSASVIEGSELKNHISEIFTNDTIAYIHIHNAKPGCFNCVVERV